ncbi:hypothetical protein C8R45DRAFT_929523 [Mycena sanguinolenta]|nr:hypothetical protein C8R45DRAFT_929523 [Mycena sanguinolenta]
MILVEEKSIAVRVTDGLGGSPRVLTSRPVPVPQYTRTRHPSRVALPVVITTSARSYRSEDRRYPPPVLCPWTRPTDRDGIYPGSTSDGFEQRNKRDDEREWGRRSHLVTTIETSHIFCYRTWVWHTLQLLGLGRAAWPVLRHRDLNQTAGKAEVTIARGTIKRPIGIARQWPMVASSISSMACTGIQRKPAASPSPSGFHWIY